MSKTTDSDVKRIKKRSVVLATSPNASTALSTHKQSQIDQALTRTNNEAELFALACQVAVESGGVNMAWIGLTDLQSERIVPVKSFGATKDYLKTICISTRPDKLEGRGPSATAYRNNQTVLCNDWANNALTAIRPQQPSYFRWGSSARFPILRKGQPIGVFSLYHQAKDFFDSERSNFFHELSHAINSALERFEQEQEHLGTLSTLSTNEQHFRAYFERSALGMTISRQDKSWLEVNQALCDMLGYTSAELLSTTWEALTHPDDIEPNNSLFQHLIDGLLDDFTLEKRLIKKSGEVIDVHLNVRAIRNTDGSFAYAVSVTEDISLRKMAERREKIRQHTLEKVARGSSLEEIMSYVIESSEAIYPDSMCSILLVDKTGTRLLSSAAPSLPDFYKQAIQGSAIGINTDSCAAAAFSGERIIVKDIATDPAWKTCKQLDAKAELGSFWSEPIRSASGSVLGTFAIYRKQLGVPDQQEIALIESAANLLGIAIDRVRAEEELHLVSSIYTSISEAVLVTDINNKTIAVNPAFTKIHGYTLDDIRDKDPAFLNSGFHDADFIESMRKEIRLQGFWQGKVWSRRKSGEVFPKWLTINTIYNDQGDIQYYVSTSSDITNKVRSDELIWRQANYDFLTALPNRHMFQDRLEQEIRKSLHENSLLALLFIDLDHFKDVNDTLGHSMGDQLLIKAAERISNCVRETDTVARMGGDEFTVILPRLKTLLDGEKIAEHIISVLAEPYCINGESIYIGASIGIAFCPNDTVDVNQPVSNADQAMYASKALGRNRLSYFTQSLHDEARNRLQLINDMRSAVEMQQFELYFQPILDFSTGRVCKAEALIRWHHPERGMISPADFIPLAEESGLIVSIGDWVFKEAADKAKRWSEGLNAELQISINMSPAQFQSADLNITDWLTYLQKIGLATQQLSVEITENLLLNASDDVKSKLFQFRDAGIEVAIDDFGVGYSTLSSLKQFDIDFLKIDQSFIQNLDTEQNDLVLCEAIVIMAQKLGLKVIAEGIETETQHQLLLNTQCNYGQGYLFSRPLPAAAFEEFLLNSMRSEGSFKNNS